MCFVIQILTSAVRFLESVHMEHASIRSAASAASALWVSATITSCWFVKVHTHTRTSMHTHSPPNPFCMETHHVLTEDSYIPHD